MAGAPARQRSVRIDTGLLYSHTPLNQEGKGTWESQLAPAPLQPSLGTGGRGLGDREGGDLRCVWGSQITEMVLSGLQSSAQKPTRLNSLH